MKKTIKRFDLKQPVTLQRIFSHIWLHEMQKQAQCSDADGRCMYRSENGRNACYVGCLLHHQTALKADNNTNEYGTATGVESIARAGILPAPLMPFLENLSTLQSLHDSIFDTAVRQRALREYAASEGLTIPE